MSLSSNIFLITIHYHKERNAFYLLDWHIKLRPKKLKLYEFYLEIELKDLEWD